MSKKMLIDATHPEETRVVVVDGNKVEEFDFETVNKRQLAGNIYLAKVTRVEPSLQAAFVDYGGNRHGFLAFSEIHPDYYQIPVADREALMAEEKAYAKQQQDEDERRHNSRGRKRPRRKPAAKAESAVNSADIVTEEVAQTVPETSDDSAIRGMNVVDVTAEDTLEPIIGFSGSAPAPVAEPQPASEATQPDEGESTHSSAEVAEWAAEQKEQDAEDAAEDIAKDVADETADTDDDVTGDDVTDEATGEATPDGDIESVAQEDEAEEIRPRRKPRPRRYKIQEVIKVRQILLIQVVKEERGNKGAALTTYLSLAGRYCVLMPNTARGGGISRKITNAADRKKLKEIANDITVPEGAGLIIRTAGANRTKAEIKRDYDYLLRQWEQVRDLTLKSIAPAPIYEEGSLIKRSIRDLYNREIDEILIEGETGYRMAKDYMKMLMPSHAKNVKHYTDPMPLFARFQVESYLSGMFNPNVQLRSGGYIVIGITEALVAIDVNSGRSTKEGSIEDTALKTNLEAADEVARQLRLRDLAGLIVIDFIDMEDRRNNAAVEKRIKERLKTDRARIQVGRISGFGLMEMSRQRLRPGMIEATTAPCPHCHGTGLTRSDDNLALSILREMEEEGVRRRTREVLVTAPVAIANYMLNQKRDHIAMIEARYGLSVRIEASATLISPDYTLEKFKTATRNVPEPSAEVVSMETSLLAKPASTETAETDTGNDVAEAPEPGDDTAEEPRKKRRRRRRRGGRGRNSEQSQDQDQTQDEKSGSDTDSNTGGENTGDTEDDKAPDEVKDQDQPATADASVDGAPAEPVTEETVTEETVTAPDQEPAKPRKKRTTKRASTRKAKAETPDAADGAADGATPDATPTEDEAPKKPKPRKRRTTKKAEPAPEPAALEPAVQEPAVQEQFVQAEPVTAAIAPEPEVAPEVATPAPAPIPEPIPEPVAEVAEEAPAKPKRRGWWSRAKK